MSESIYRGDYGTRREWDAAVAEACRRGPWPVSIYTGSREQEAAQEREPWMDPYIDISGGPNPRVSQR